MSEIIFTAAGQKSSTLPSVAVRGGWGDTETSGMPNWFATFAVVV